MTPTNTPQSLLLLITLLLISNLALSSPLSTPSSLQHSLKPIPRQVSPTARATPTTKPRLPYPIPGTYNGTAFPHPTGTGRIVGTGTGLPRMTMAPGLDANGTRFQAAQKDIPFIQTTYWSCVQWPTTVHCGWHKPILAVGDAAVAQGAAPSGGPRRGGSERTAARRAGAVALGLVLGGFVLSLV